ncbi:CU044_5270 family protein [Kribbella deserti]|uniref:CU044_5270 family protein n=1 Tax=Kribbella deserti TaxID=1926257 RepID=A0ABV6QSU8_9ACTN
MDEFDKIRSAYPERPGPSSDVRQQARRQVQALATEELNLRRRDRWLASARSGRFGIALTATAATVALAALGAPLVLSPKTGADAVPVPGTSSAPNLRLSAASEALLAAAIQQESNEVATGKYFRIRSLWYSDRTVGKPGRSYKVERRQIAESWTPPRQGDEAFFGWADFGYHPATEADKVKWRADGSPRSWQLSYERTPITIAPEAPRLRSMREEATSHGYYIGGTDPLTAAQIAQLPTDPVALKAFLGRNVDQSQPAELGVYTIFAAASYLLSEAPSSPKLRGAALRVLAGLPDVSLREGVKDPIGRPGSLISLSTKLDGAAYTSQLIIDRNTGRLLCAQDHSPRQRSKSVVLASGWTNDTPKPPVAKLP